MPSPPGERRRDVDEGRARDRQPPTPNEVRFPARAGSRAEESVRLPGLVRARSGAGPGSGVGEGRRRVRHERPVIAGRAQRQLHRSEDLVLAHPRCSPRWCRSPGSRVRRCRPQSPGSRSGPPVPLRTFSGLVGPSTLPEGAGLKSWHRVESRGDAHSGPALTASRGDVAADRAPTDDPRTRATRPAAPRPVAPSIACSACNAAPGTARSPRSCSGIPVSAGRETRKTSRSTIGGSCPGCRRRRCSR